MLFIVSVISTVLVQICIFFFLKRVFGNTFIHKPWCTILPVSILQLFTCNIAGIFSFQANILIIYTHIGRADLLAKWAVLHTNKMVTADPRLWKSSLNTM